MQSYDLFQRKPNKNLYDWKIICYFATDNYHGVLSESAEIIPIEPDADNADEGNMI